MGRLPIIEKSGLCTETASGLLPAAYMADYSILSLVVDALDPTIRLLKTSGMAVHQTDRGVTLEFDHIGQVRAAAALLADHDIGYTLSDGVRGLYQG